MWRVRSHWRGTYSRSFTGGCIVPCIRFREFLSASDRPDLLDELLLRNKASLLPSDCLMGVLLGSGVFAAHWAWGPMYWEWLTTAGWQG